MRFVVVLLCLAGLLVFFGAQSEADFASVHPRQGAMQSAPAVIEAEPWLEPVTMVFIVGGTIAMGLWGVGRRLGWI